MILVLKPKCKEEDDTVSDPIYNPRDPQFPEKMKSSPDLRQLTSIYKRNSNTQKENSNTKAFFQKLPECFLTPSRRASS